ncbi:MAG: 4-alpha-glucanotransferase [Firmicutes bacterium]|nr:4-alpha-glucanotransferase [Bacillota bacterium]
MTDRGSGILMHITSIPSPYGIGTFGKEAYNFVDFLERAGQKYWQILPLGPTSFGDSPYMALSSFAGNPYLIDFDFLIKEGLLVKKDLKNKDFGHHREKVNYKKIFNNKLDVLKIAYNNCKNKYEEEINNFIKENKNWLEDYSLFMALKYKFNLKSWLNWDKDIKLRKKFTLKRYKKELKDETEYWNFLQYIFFKQWNELKKYANSKGIKIIGDIPIYVAVDSVDTWANSEIFMLDEENMPINVSGCPPDSFSETGQLWGNPLYRWDVLEKRNFDWWIERIRGSKELYDVIRIDHFRGFQSYWSIPFEDITAENGHWIKGPGKKFINKLKESFDDLDIIAEDLGFLTKDTYELLKYSGYPGMKVLQFAFNSTETNNYLPHNYEKNCVVYTGTHDNNTIYGWFETANKKDINFAIDYLNLSYKEGYNWGFIRGVWSSVGNIAIAQMQDFLGLKSKARMNTPSTLNGNWQWRVRKEDLTYELIEKIKNITRLYGR